MIVYATGSATNESFPLGLVQQVLDVATTPATTPTTEAPAPAHSVTGSPAVTG